jgi:two-component system, LuxR family, sensor kinase FixL
MNFSWITIVWSMVAAASLTLASMHLMVWFKNRAAWANLLFAVTAVATTAMAACELWMMRAETAEQFGTALRWLHVPAWIVILSLTGFVLLHLRAGRPWLAWTIAVLRTFSLLLNFLVGQNLNYREITALRHVQFLGESVAVAEGIANPWMLVGQLALWCFIIFIVDAAITVWRRGERRQALVTGGSIVFCILAATVQALLVVWGYASWPITSSLYFMLIVAAMSYEMSRDVLRAAQLVRQLETSEAALRLSERRYDQAAEAAGIGAWEWDVVRDEIWASDRGRELFGLAPDQRIDFATVTGVVHPEDRDGLRKTVARSLEAGGNYEREYRVVLPAGGERWIATRGRVEADARGKPVLMRGVSIDITRRKEIEAELRESEARFRSMANTAPVMLWMAGTDKLCTFFNESWLAFTGRKLAQELGNGWADGVHRDDLERCLQTYGSAFDARRTFTMEYRLRGADGEYHWVVDTGAPRLAPDGTFLGYIGSCLDITERKRSDDLLKKERAFLRQVIDVDPNLIFAKNRAGQFTLVNQAVADVFGTTVENIVGKTDADFSPNVAEIEHFRRIDLEVMDTLKEQFVAEEPITTAKGNVMWLQTVKRPILDERGTADQILGSATDITRRREAEFELALQRNELAHLSRVAMLGELSGSLAHELNQPLTAILSNAQAAQRFLARDNPDLNEVREILQDIVNDDKRAGEVISGLRLLLTKGQMQSQPLDLNHVVSDVLRLVRSDLLNSGVIVNTDLLRGLPAATGDRVQLQQVMINLVVNGCEAMASVDGAARQLAVRTALTAEGEVCVSVSDLGHGIPHHNLERVFDPFFTTKTHGLGLGLAVCRTIVAAQGGRLWAANNTGRGASFHFTLPAVSRTV